MGWAAVRRPGQSGILTERRPRERPRAASADSIASQPGHSTGCRPAARRAGSGSSGRSRRASTPASSEQRGRRLLRARAVGADHPGRAAFDPARHVLADRGAALAQHPARRVRDRRRHRVERQAGQRHALVAHRAQHQLRRDVLVRARARHRAPLVRGRPLEAHPADRAVRAAQHLHRAQEEPQADAPVGLEPAGSRPSPAGPPHCAGSRRAGPRPGPRTPGPGPVPPPRCGCRRPAACPARAAPWW